MNKSLIIPTMRYQNAKMAINWLCDAFGFEKHLVVESENNEITHAQLVWNNAMIMLGSVRNDEFGKYQISPSDLQGVNTQSVYIVVSDLRKHYNKAKAAGAEILIDYRTEEYGGDFYCCKDMEGHIWSFGTYDPWKN